MYFNAIWCCLQLLLGSATTSRQYDPDAFCFCYMVVMGACGYVVVVKKWAPPWEQEWHDSTIIKVSWSGYLVLLLSPPDATIVHHGIGY